MRQLPWPFLCLWIGGFVAIALMTGANWFDSANAAPPADLAECVPFAKAATIIFYRCEDDETGLSIFANSMGFMVMEQ